MIKSVKYLLLMGMLFLLAVPLVNAFEFDNTKSFNKDISEYGKVTIKNWFGFQKLVELELKENTDFCSSNCEATTEIVMYQEGVLVDSIIFETVNKDDSRVEEPINNYSFYIQTGIKEVEIEKVIKVGTGEFNSTGEILKDVVIYDTIEEPLWEEYSFGDIVQPGIYNIKLKGEKEVYKKVDWIITSQGKEIREWAIWGAGATKVYEAHGVAFDSSNTFTFKRGAKINITRGVSVLLDKISVSVSSDSTMAYLTDSALNVIANASFDAGKNASFNNLLTAGEVYYVLVDKLGASYSSSFKNGGAGLPKISGNITWVMGRGTGDTEVDNPGWISDILGLTFVLQKISLISPDDNYFTSSLINIFNATATQTVNIINASLWTNKSGTMQPCNVSTGLSATSVNSSLTCSFTTDGFYLWNYEFCDIDGDCAFSLENRTFSIDTTGPLINIIYPTATIGYQVKDNLLDVNWTLVESHLDSCFLEYAGTNYTINGAEGNHTINTTSYNYRNIIIWCNDSFGSEASNSTSWDYKFFATSQTYNTSSYETASETFTVNVSFLGEETLTANLIYDNTSYSATKYGNNTEANFLKILDIPKIRAGSQNTSFYWELLYGSTKSNSTTYTQEVTATNLSRCDNSTYLTPFMNITFKNDDDESAMNGSIDTSTWSYYFGGGDVIKSFRYERPTQVNTSYAFCVNPTDRNLYTSVDMQFSASGFPQRRYSDTSLILTNATTNKVLYLLSSADGSYSTYQVQDAAGSAIQNVSTTVERQYSGTWTTVEQGSTGGDGAVTFWLNPDFDHRLTFTKTGYTAYTTTIRPTQSTYSITLAGGGDNEASYNYTLKGIKWVITPGSGRLNPSTVYTFGFNVTHVNNSNLVGCRLRLLDKNDVELNSTTGCTSTGGYISVDHTTPSDGKMWGEYSLDIGGGYIIVDGDAYWHLITRNSSQGTIWNSLNRMRTLDMFGDESGRQEFSRVILFFLVLMILLGFLSYSTGWDAVSAGGTILIITILIWMASFTGFLELSNLSKFEFIDKYFVAYISSCLGAGYMLNRWRRT